MPTAICKGNYVEFNIALSWHPSVKRLVLYDAVFDRVIKGKHIAPALEQLLGDLVMSQQSPEIIFQIRGYFKSEGFTCNPKISGSDLIGHGRVSAAETLINIIRLGEIQPFGDGRHVMG